MTPEDWTTIFDLVRTFVAGGICIGFVAAVAAAASN